LQPPSAKEALHLYSLIERSFLSYLRLLVIFFVVHAHCVLVNSDKAACLTLQPVQRLSKLVYRLRGLIRKLNLCWDNRIKATKVLNNLFLSCSRHVVMLQEMRVKINDSSVMLLAY
jgi:hypothetical protein